MLETKNPYYVENGTVIRPLDPITHEVMQPGVMAESLLADDDLRQGYQFMQEHADSIRFTLLLSPHGSVSGLARANIDLHKEANAIKEAGGVLFLECVGQTEEERLAKQATFNMISGLPAADAYEYRLFLMRLAPSFQTETEIQLAGTGVRVVMPDYVEDSERPADQALTQWDHHLKEKTGQLEKFDQAVEWEALKLGYVSYRDQYLLCKMGASLAKLSKEQLLGDPIEATLLAGSAHANVGQFAENLNIPVTYRGEHGEQVSGSTKNFLQAVGNAALAVSR